tara:strand:- start:3004 stop:3672 length:669 start_codon:yes stop_codon:yes gene_type:complete
VAVTQQEAQVSTHISTFADVYNEILVRVNDPDGDTYTDRAKELVYEGISALAVSGNYDADHMPGLVKAKRLKAEELGNPYRIKVSGDGTDLDNDILLKIVAIVDDHTTVNTSTQTGQAYIDPETPQSVIRQRYIPITLAEVNRLNTADEQPFFDELYYYRRGDYIYFHPLTNMDNQKLIVHYIKAPHNLVTDDTMTELFSLDFLYKVVDYGVGRIREEQAGQ